jgi:hypothetical protein
MALVAAFDLETAQLDSVNAFLNSVLDEIVYCEFPEGFEESGNCLLLKRALYGLLVSVSSVDYDGPHCFGRKNYLAHYAT